MFSIVSGEVREVGRDFAIVNANGVGFEIQLLEPLAATLNVGDQVTLHTLLIKRPDEISLSGFGSFEEIELFRFMTGVPGVGPKIANAALATLGHVGVSDAIRRGNEPMLRRIPGVGPQMAAKLIISLRAHLARR